jgi:hypothetical protein
MIEKKRKTFMDFRTKLNEDDLSNPNPAAAPEQPTAPQPAPAPEPKPAPAPSDDSASKRASVAEKIKPQYELAKSVIEGINKAFADDCAKTTKYDTMGDQIKNFEKQIRGACQQTISIVEQEKFDWHDWNNCSPKSFKCITLYDDRDMDVLKLCAGVIVFYNSLLGVN